MIKDSIFGSFAYIENLIISWIDQGINIKFFWFFIQWFFSKDLLNDSSASGANLFDIFVLSMSD